MKKSFILYNDSLEVLELLTDEQAGKIFKSIAEYQKGNEKELPPELKFVFHSFKKQFDRDEEKYEEFCAMQSQRRLSKTKSTDGHRRSPTVTETTDGTNTDSDSDSDSDKEKERINTDFQKKLKKEKVLEKSESILNFPENSFEYQTALSYLTKSIQINPELNLALNSPEKQEKAILENADAVDKLKRIDGLTENQITTILKETLEDKFWKRQIRTVRKFREKNKEGIPYWGVMAGQIKETQSNSIKSY